MKTTFLETTFLCLVNYEKPLSKKVVSNKENTTLFQKESVFFFLAPENTFLFFNEE
jgi:hypothetical protein